jgi:hypothetical protein
MLQIVPASNARVHVILKQQCPRRRELLSQISRDQCLKVRAAPQGVRAELRDWSVSCD